MRSLNTHQVLKKNIFDFRFCLLFLLWVSASSSCLGALSHQELSSPPPRSHSLPEKCPCSLTSPGMLNLRPAGHTWTHNKHTSGCCEVLSLSFSLGKLRRQCTSWNYLVFSGKFFHFCDCPVQQFRMCKKTINKCNLKNLRVCLFECFQLSEKSVNNKGGANGRKR